MPISRRSLALVALLAALGAGQARAHFLFIRVNPTAEAGRYAEVFFSEQAEAGDPKYVERFVGSKLWIQQKPGEFKALELTKAVDRLRAKLPAMGSVSVIGISEYGVIARPNQTPFLLRYYPKALAGSPTELAHLEPKSDVPLEIVAEVADDSLKLKLLVDGKPMPGAVFNSVAADLTEEKINAGIDGVATWKPSTPGRYSIYTRRDLKTPGETGGMKYDEIREFATLALEWPLGREGADPEAVALFEGAIASRAQWKDFPGFSADVSGTIEGRPFDGKLTVSPEGKVEMTSDEAVAKAWVEDQLGSLAMHRRVEAASTPPPVLRFADSDDLHPLGRLLLFQGGRFASSYRVKDGRITEVNRHVGKMDMTILALDDSKNAEGRDLPRGYVVQYWDAGTGNLDRVETVRDTWARVGAYDLPVEHSVTNATSQGLAVRGFTLAGHKLADAK
ncbi:DUF3386 family protein [Isosphaeraceae bacterium EP7]